MSIEASDGLLIATLAATRTPGQLWFLAQALARAATIRELESGEDSKAEEGGDRVKGA